MAVREAAKLGFVFVIGVCIGAWGLWSLQRLTTDGWIARRTWHRLGAGESCVQGRLEWRDPSGVLHVPQEDGHDIPCAAGHRFNR